MVQNCTVLWLHSGMQFKLRMYTYLANLNAPINGLPQPPPPPPSAGTDGAFGWGLIITIWLIIHENNYDACAFNVLTTVERIGQVYYLILTYKNAGVPFAPHSIIGMWGIKNNAPG